MSFSIVITTYNRERLLQRAVRSALAQTSPCEIVVVDDASTDGTATYMQGLHAHLCAVADTRVVYHRNLQNLGHSESVNVGVKLAQGDWIKLVDDDDYLAPDCIEHIEHAVALRPDAVICSCQAAQVDANGKEISRTREAGPGQVFYIPQADIHYGMLIEHVPFGTPIQVAFSRKAFLESGGWDPALDTNCDDIDSWIKIAQYGDAVFINECLAYRTIWPGAHNNKFSIQKRLETNILIKEKLYTLVNSEYQHTLPTIGVIQDYLKLHWSLAALKRKQIFSALKIIWPAALSLAAWQFLINAHQDKTRSQRVRKLILVEQPNLNRAKLLRPAIQES